MSRILEGPEAIAEGIARLRDARVVAFPTETVYGLGADALNADAVRAVFTLKGRPSTNPLIVHVSGIEMARCVVAEWNEQAEQIARAHWPGPITIVLPKHESVPDIVCASGTTVAVRCPAHPVALALIESFGGPLVGPSANPSGWISPTTPDHVRDGFPEDDLIIIDGGACRAGIESTVLDLSNEQPQILRQGVLGAEALRNTLCVDILTSKESSDTDSPARSPGLLGPHYQPRTPCRLVSTEQARDLDDPSIALIAWSIQAHPRGGQIALLDDSAESYAAGLYAAMHRCDRADCAEIWIETPPAFDDAERHETRSIWDAISERLARATQSG